MTNGPRKPKKGSYTNKPKGHVERPETFPMPTEEDAVTFAVNAGFGVNASTEYPRIASRPDQPERKFQLKRVMTDSKMNKGVRVPAFTWMEVK